MNISEATAALLASFVEYTEDGTPVSFNESTGEYVAITDRGVLRALEERDAGGRYTTGGREGHPDKEKSIFRASKDSERPSHGRSATLAAAIGTGGFTAGRVLKTGGAKTALGALGTLAGIRAVKNARRANRDSYADKRKYDNWRNKRR